MADVGCQMGWSMEGWVDGWMVRHLIPATSAVSLTGRRRRWHRRRRGVHAETDRVSTRHDRRSVPARAGDTATARAARGPVAGAAGTVLGPSGDRHPAGRAARRARAGPGASAACASLLSMSSWIAIARSCCSRISSSCRTSGCRSCGRSMGRARSRGGGALDGHRAARPHQEGAVVPAVRGARMLAGVPAR